MKNTKYKDRYLHLLSLTGIVFPVLFYILMNWSTARYGFLNGGIDIDSVSETASKLYTPLFAVNLLIILLLAMTIVLAVFSVFYDNLLQFRMPSYGLLAIISATFILEIAYTAMAIPSSLYGNVCDILISVFMVVYFALYLVLWIIIVKKPFDQYLIDKHEKMKREALAETEKKVDAVLHQDSKPEEELTPEQRREKIKAMIELAKEKNAISQEEANALLSQLEDTKES